MSTTSSSFMEAIIASRKGAALMARSDYENAILVFRHALITLKNSVESDSQIPRLQAWRLTTMPMPSQERESYGNGCAIFDKCFLIMPMPCQEKVPTSDKFALVSSVLLYNTGLAYHAKASLEEKPKQTELHKMAAKLYQRASQLLQGLDATSDGAALMLALSNNLATLALEFSDLTSFYIHREILGSYLAITNTTGAFYSSFFAGNFAVTSDVHKRPAAAA